MSFKIKRIISLVLSFSPIIFIILCIIFPDFIIDNNLIWPVFGIAFVLMILALASIFVLARCPRCNMPITPISLLTHPKQCPYCKEDYEIKEQES